MQRRLECSYHLTQFIYVRIKLIPEDQRQRQITTSLPEELFVNTFLPLKYINQIE